MPSRRRSALHFRSITEKAASYGGLLTWVGELAAAGEPLLLNRRVPGHRHFAIARAALLHMGERGERVVETLHQHPFGDQHIVDAPSGGFRLRPVLVVECMPARVTCKQERHMRDVSLHEDFRISG